MSPQQRHLLWSVACILTSMLVLMGILVWTGLVGICTAAWIAAAVVAATIAGAVR